MIDYFFFIFDTHNRCMNKILLLFLLLCSPCFAQEPLVIELQKGARPIEIINLNDKGTFMLIGKDVQVENGLSKLKPGDLGTRLVYISPDQSIIWNKPFPLEPDNQLDNYYIACSDTFIYFIEALGGTLTKSNYLITQMDHSGATRIFEYNAPIKTDKIYDLYCDNENLYFYYDENKDSKKPYHFIGINHKTFKATYIDIFLKKIPKKKEELSFERWLFTGIHKGLFYFYMKSAKSSRNCTYEFAAVNKKGEIEKQLTLDNVLDNDQYVAPTNNPHIGQSWTDSDFNFLSTGENSYPSIGSLGDLYMDFDKECFYIYGNYNDGPFDNTGLPGKMIGFFLNKYDLKGQAVWKKNIPFPKELKDPSLRSAMYNTREVFFEKDPKTGHMFLDVICTTSKKKYTMIVDSTGKYLKYNIAENLPIPEVERSYMRSPLNYKGATTVAYKKTNKYVDGIDSKAMRKMEELSKNGSKKASAAKLKNPEFASYNNLYHILRATKFETLIEASFGEGKIKIYSFPR